MGLLLLLGETGADDGRHLVGNGVNLFPVLGLVVDEVQVGVRVGLGLEGAYLDLLVDKGLVDLGESGEVPLDSISDRLGGVANAGTQASGDVKIGPLASVFEGLQDLPIIE